MTSSPTPQSQSDIPDDIMQAATAVCRTLSRIHLHEDEALVIARAILAERNSSKWQPIETAELGPQVMVWEPMYGWLIACCEPALDGSWTGKWRLKSSGNFWMDCPESVKFTHWQPLPTPPEGK